MKKKRKKVSNVKRSVDKFESKNGGPKLESKEYEMIDFSDYNPNPSQN